MPRARTASSRPKRGSRFPACGFTLDGLTCGERGRHFCEPRARKVVAFIQEICVHTKADWARQPFVLDDWQREEIVRPVFGWVRWDRERRRYVRAYRIVWIELARKNGKSLMLAAIALYLLIGDDEQGSEIYGCAKDTKQARKVWDVAHRMTQLSPTLRRLRRQKRLVINIQEKRIVYVPTGSYYEVITRDALGELGGNPHGVIFDEVVSQPDRTLWDTLRTGMGVRAEPLMVAATTAGNDLQAFAAQEHDYCARVARNPRLDPVRFVYIRNTPPTADPWDERNWYHANPALGRFLSVQALRDEAREARNNPAAEVAFRTYRLNQWIPRASNPLVTLEAWDTRPNIQIVDEAKLVGLEAFGGVDLAATTALTALAWSFRAAEGWRTIWRFWAPSDALRALDKATGGQASAWVRQGYIQLVDGAVISQASVEEQVLADARLFKVVELDYDPWQSLGLVERLSDALGGVAFVEHRQTMAHMSHSTKELRRLVLEGLYRHGGNPVMRWMIEGTLVLEDNNGNIKPDRQGSKSRIDGVVAAIMALSAAQRPREPAERTLEGDLFV